MQGDLFGTSASAQLQPQPRQALGPGAWLLRGFALPWEGDLQVGLAQVLAAAPWREVLTPLGPMSVQQSHCGAVGWTADRQGYRYAPHDPLTGAAWPAMPAAWLALAREAALAADYAGFAPDTCLINRYAPGSRMGLHQDRDERDMRQPIVSVSLGLPAFFLWGGLTRAARAERVPLLHGDVVVWGGASRLRYHGVAPLREAPPDARWGAQRINLTFRCSGG
jgi:alkylated DNA repair protein (DNA oxidative demethylase)